MTWPGAMECRAGLGCLIAVEGIVVERLSARVGCDTVVRVAACCVESWWREPTDCCWSSVWSTGTSNGGKEALDLRSVWRLFGRRSDGAIRGSRGGLRDRLWAIGSFSRRVGYDLTGSYTVVVIALAVISLRGWSLDAGRPTAQKGRGGSLSSLA